MARTPSTMLALGKSMPAFTLMEPKTNQQVFSSQFEGEPLLVAFICNHCPYVVHIREALAAYGERFHQQQMSVVAINANDVVHYPDDSPDKMVEEANLAGYNFPYLFDESQAVATAFEAACTPDFFLFDAKGRLFYRGEFDASRPGNDLPVTGEALIAATERLLAGEDAPEIQKPSLGCNIKWKPGNEPAYFG